MILLILCKWLPCNVSKLFFRYHGCIVSTKDLNLSPWHQNTIFCISGQMNARLSVLCMLERAKRRNSGPVRLQVRLSVLASVLHAYRHA